MSEEYNGSTVQSYQRQERFPVDAQAVLSGIEQSALVASRHIYLLLRAGIPLSLSYWDIEGHRVVTSIPLRLKVSGMNSKSPVMGIVSTSLDVSLPLSLSSATCVACDPS